MNSSEQRAEFILTTLEQLREELVKDREHDTARYISIAILHHKMKRYGISDAELKDLCDAMLAEQEAAEAARNSVAHRRRRPPLLRLVK